MSEFVDPIIKILTQTEFDLFKKVVTDYLEFYKSGLARLVFSGPRMGLSLRVEFTDVITTKNNIQYKQFNNIIKSYVQLTHFILEEEITEIQTEYEEKLNEREYDELIEKVDWCKLVLKENPDIINGWKIYTNPILNYFEDIDWDITLLQMKHDNYLSSNNVPIVSPNIKITTREFSMTQQVTAKNVSFVIGKNDLNFLIKSLEILRDKINEIEINYGDKE